MFSSYQGEGGTVSGSCQGKRQVFIRLAGCNLAKAKRPCIWCDSPSAHEMKTGEFRLEKEPGCMNFEFLPNPVDAAQIKEYIERLRTPDLHSISLTGGEPLYQPDFLKSICKEGKDEIYLETNGTLPKAAKKMAAYVDFACVDIKDETAIPYKDWKGVVKKELKTIEYLKEAGALVFAKVVVTAATKPQNIEWYAKELKRLGAPLAIQPVTTGNASLRIGLKKLFKLTETAAQYLSAKDITLSLQAHKAYGFL